MKNTERGDHPVFVLRDRRKPREDFEYAGWRFSRKQCLIGGCIHKFLDWPPGERTANGTALCY